MILNQNLKEGPPTKNGPIDFNQSFWQYKWNNPIRFMVKRKRGVAPHFWAHKMHVKDLIWLAQSQCYDIGRKELLRYCQGFLLKIAALTHSITHTLKHIHTQIIYLLSFFFITIIKSTNTNNPNVTQQISYCCNFYKTNNHSKWGYSVKEKCSYVLSNNWEGLIATKKVEIGQFVVFLKISDRGTPGGH
jgi:hypothetical protein